MKLEQNTRNTRMSGRYARMLALLAGLVLAGLSPAQAATPAVDVDDADSLERMTARQRMEKRDMLRQSLALTPEQSDRFWPIYYEYQARLITIYDRKFALIEQYAGAYPHLTEKQSDHLVRESLTNHKAQTALLETYYRRLAKAFSNNIAARFVQLESVWNGAYDGKLLSRLPLIPLPDPGRRR